MTLHAAVIELPDNFAESPDLIVRRTRADLVKAVVTFLATQDKVLTGGLGQFILDDDWLTEHPIPSLTMATDDALSTWLGALSNILSGFYWTLFTIDGIEVEAA